MTDVHPDDEALSAHLDGEEPGLADHIEGCASCAERLGQLRRIRGALAAPVDAVPRWQRDAAIARALSAAPGGPAEPWYRGAAGRAAGIAAALMLVASAAFAVTQLADGRGEQGTTAAGEPVAGRGAGSKAPTATVAPETVGDLGDLGELASSAALRAIVAPKTAEFALARGARTSGQESPPNPAAPSAQTDAQDDAAQDKAEADVRKRDALDCAAKTQALDPDNIGPTYAGTATWQGTPASVLVYAVQGQENAVNVYVVARSDCRVLEFQSYRP